MNNMMTVSMPRLKLLVMWGIWLVILVYISALLIIGMPDFYQYLASSFSDLEQSLQQFSITRNLLAYYVIGWHLVAMLPFFVVALLVFWRKSGDLFAVFASTVFVAFGVGFSSYVYLPEIYKGVFAPPLNYHIARTVDALGFSTSLTFLFLFPTGRFVPRWTRWIALVWSLWMACGVALPAVLINNLPTVVFILVQVVVYGVAIYTQVYRYRHISTPVQRQQTKWAIWGFSLTLLGLAISQSIWLFLPNDNVFLARMGYLLVDVPFYHAPRALTAVALGFAILRYRLWDIDFFINRSLVYAGLSVLLGLVFVAVFAMTETVLRGLVWTTQTRATGAVSAIAVLALFLPIRNSLQRFVDSRIYGVDPNREWMVQAAIAQERDRLSRELHDSVTQSLYGLTLLAESWRRLAHDSKIENLEEPLVEIGDVAEQALKEMRLLIHELRPPLLEKEGLLGALRQRLAAVEKRAGVKVDLTVDDVTELPVAMEEALYYIATEALNNAIKHAAATSVKVSLHAEGGWVELEIADDGKGFDAGSVGARGGMGLANMRERAEDLGGTLTIWSAPGQGTKTAVRMPIQSGPRKHRAKVPPWQS